MDASGCGVARRVVERPLQAVELVLSDGTIRSGARAVFETLAYAGLPQWLWAYRRLPGFAPITAFSLEKDFAALSRDLE